MVQKKRMEEMSWVEFEECSKVFDTILLPMGSVEGANRFWGHGGSGPCDEGERGGDHREVGPLYPRVRGGIQETSRLGW